MKISIASDHAGFEQKQQLAAYLKGEGHEVIDRGPDSDNRVDYPDFAVKVGGIGMAMAVDKMEGIRAANVVRRDFAVLCREHNDANVITLSGRFVSLEDNESILDAFIATEFAGGRHAGRVEKINALD